MPPSSPFFFFFFLFSFYESELFIYLFIIIIIGYRRVLVYSLGWDQARAEHFRFGPVLDQNKQLNRIYIFLVFDPNRTENRFKPINFGSVRFFSLPNRFKPKL